MVGADAVTSDEVGAFDDGPDRPVGLPFANADVTDESLAERVARETPEVADDPDEPLALVEPDVLVDSDLLEHGRPRSATSSNQTDPPGGRCDQIGRNRFEAVELPARHRSEGAIARSRSWPCTGVGMSAPSTTRRATVP